MNSFTEEEVAKLKESPYVQNVFPNRIIYGEVFEREYHRLMNEGVHRLDAFELLGLDPNIIGKYRVKDYHHNYIARLKSDSKRIEQFNSETVSEELNKLRHEVEVLRQENEFLKKKRQIDARFKNKKR